MSSSTQRRIDKLSGFLAGLAAELANPKNNLNINDIAAKFESFYSLDPGSLSRTPEESYAKGFGSMAAEFSSSIGLELREFKAVLLAARAWQSAPL